MLGHQTPLVTLPSEEDRSGNNTSRKYLPVKKLRESRGRRWGIKLQGPSWGWFHHSKNHSVSLVHITAEQRIFPLIYTETEVDSTLHTWMKRKFQPPTGRDPFALCLPFFISFFFNGNTVNSLLAGMWLIMITATGCPAPQCAKDPHGGLLALSHLIF